MDSGGTPTAPGATRRLLERAPVPAALGALLGVYLLGVGSVLFAPAGSTVAVWWPAAGLGVAMLVLAPPRWRAVLAVGIVLASSLANYTAGRPWEAALGFSLANATEALVVTWWLTRGRGDRASLRTMEDLWRLLIATALGTLLVGLGIGLTVRYVLDGSFTGAALAVMASHAAAILVVAPLALEVRGGPREPRYETSLQAALLLLTVVLVFSPGQTLGLTFLPVPLLLWASLRFGLRVVSYELIAVAILITTMTAAGGGPFAISARTGVTTSATTASLVQAYLIVTALVALSLAVAVDQRRGALDRVSQSEELFRKSFRESFVGMLLLHSSPEGLRVRELNQTAADILGGAVEDFEDRLVEPLLGSGIEIGDVVARMQRGELAGWREELWLAATPPRRVGVAISPLSTSDAEAMFSAQMIDITETYEAAARLRTEKDFTDAILSTSAALIVAVDVEGKIVGLNPAGERASGYDEASTLGRLLCGTLVPEEDAAQLRPLLERTRPGAATTAFESDLLTATGRRRRRVTWTAAPLTDPDGRRTHVVLTGIDVTEERNVRSMTQGLLDSATGTAFIGLNRRGMITIFNTGAQELLGYSSDDVTGRLRVEQLHDPKEMLQVAAEAGTEPGFPAMVAGVDGAPLTRDWTLVRKDGSRVVCAVTLSRVHDAFGAHIGYLAVGRDVTESRRSQRILVETLEKERQAVERLQELDRAKSDFVSMVSHELRTPITSIVGYTEMLQDGAAGAVSPEQDRLLDAVRRNGERLIALIEDLLTLSRIEAGTFHIQRTTLDLRQVMTRAREALGPTLADRDVDVRFDAPEATVPVLGDAGQLERVVLNLVGNAVKFTEDGGRVHCSLSVADGLAEVEVSDTGIGIPDDEQDALFTRFFRSRTAQERAIQGTGLGLTIVQSIVHSHGGEISIRSRHLVGTEVRVRLPLDPAADRLGVGAAD